jgi:hypothetical protein
VKHRSALSDLDGCRFCHGGVVFSSLVKLCVVQNLKALRRTVRMSSFSYRSGFGGYCGKVFRGAGGGRMLQVSVSSFGFEVLTKHISILVSGRCSRPS